MLDVRDIGTEEQNMRKYVLSPMYPYNDTLPYRCTNLWTITQLIYGSVLQAKKKLLVSFWYITPGWCWCSEHQHVTHSLHMVPWFDIQYDLALGIF